MPRLGSTQHKLAPNAGRPFEPVPLLQAEGLTARFVARRGTFGKVTHRAQPIASLQSSLSFGYDPDLTPLPFDPVAAKAALEAAGVVAGSTVDLSFVGDDATFREVAQTLAAYLQGVGLTVSLKSYESSAYCGDVIPKGTTGAMFEFNWSGWTFDFDNTAYLLYHSGRHWNPFVKNAALDALLDKQRASSDVEERRAALREVARYAAGGGQISPIVGVVSVVGAMMRRPELRCWPQGPFEASQTASRRHRWRFDRALRPAR